MKFFPLILLAELCSEHSNFLKHRMKKTHWVTCPPITPKNLKQVFLQCKLEPLSYFICLFIYLFISSKATMNYLSYVCTKMYMAKLT